MNRRVAIKVLHHFDSSATHRFRREAVAAGKLEHPGIATVYKSGTTDDGSHFLAMQLVRGKNLAQALAESAPPSTAAGVRKRLEMFREIVERMGADGWLGVGWPQEYGGQGRTGIEQLIWFEEARRSGAPMPFVTLNTVGPTLISQVVVMPGIRRKSSGTASSSIGCTSATRALYVDAACPI